jgi:hypothetical protein
MKGSRMKPYDPSLCMRCEEQPVALGSSFCKACDDHFTHPQPKAKPEKARQPARPTTRIGYIPPRG